MTLRLFFLIALALFNLGTPSTVHADPDGDLTKVITDYETVLRDAPGELERESKGQSQASSSRSVWQQFRQIGEQLTQIRVDQIRDPKLKYRFQEISFAVGTVIGGVAPLPVGKGHLYKTSLYVRAPELADTDLKLIDQLLTQTIELSRLNGRGGSDNTSMEAKEHRGIARQMLAAKTADPDRKKALLAASIQDLSEKLEFLTPDWLTHREKKLSRIAASTSKLNLKEADLKRLYLKRQEALSLLRASGVSNDELSGLSQRTESPRTVRAPKRSFADTVETSSESASASAPRYKKAKATCPPPSASGGASSSAAAAAAGGSCAIDKAAAQPAGNQLHLLIQAAEEIEKRDREQEASESSDSE